MSINYFERVVRQATSSLVQRGYQFQEGKYNDLKDFWKIITTGVACRITFQLLESPSLVQMFQISLSRQRLRDFPENEMLYAPLHIPLLNLIEGFYKVNIFPPGNFAWEFTDESSLLEQLAAAQSLIIDYGIKWLEDPLSNIEWVKRHKDQA